jgi:hypothetical protein
MHVPSANSVCHGIAPKQAFNVSAVSLHLQLQLPLSLYCGRQLVLHLQLNTQRSL